MGFTAHQHNRLFRAENAIKAVDLYHRSIGVGRFRILVGVGGEARFRILVGPRWGGIPSGHMTS